MVELVLSRFKHVKGVNVKIAHDEEALNFKVTLNYYNVIITAVLTLAQFVELRDALKKSPYAVIDCDAGEIYAGAYAGRRTHRGLIIIQNGARYAPRIMQKEFAKLNKWYPSLTIVTAPILLLCKKVRKRTSINTTMAFKKSYGLPDGFMKYAVPEKGRYLAKKHFNCYELLQKII